MDLIVPRATRLECSVLKAVTAHYVWISHEVTRARQRELLMELAELLIEGAPDTLDPIFHMAYAEARDESAFAPSRTRSAETIDRAMSSCTVNTSARLRSYDADQS